MGGRWEVFGWLRVEVLSHQIRKECTKLTTSMASQVQSGYMSALSPEEHVG